LFAWAGSQIFCYCLEFVHCLTLLVIKRADRLVKAMVQMVLNKGAFGLCNGLFDRVKLLGEVEAWLPLLNHSDDAPEVSLGPFKPFDNFRMGGVILFGHDDDLSPWRG
jgi:hypothetical protein